MAINIITHKIGDSSTTEEINRLHLHLCRKRVFTMTLPYQPVAMHCVTDDAEGLHPNINIIAPSDNEAITDPKFHLIQLLDHSKFQNDKNIFWEPSLIPMDLCQTRIIAGFPNAGDHKEAMDYIPNMDIELGMRIKNESLPFIQMPTKWWDVESTEDGGTEFAVEDWMITYWGIDARHLLTEFNADPVKAQALGFGEFIRTNFKGIILPTEPGSYAPYYIGDIEKNDELNAQFESNVRPYFPEQWTGHGGEEEAPFLARDHEYRDITKQVKFLYLDTSNGTDIKDDWYCQLWFM